MDDQEQVTPMDEELSATIRLLASRTGDMSLVDAVEEAVSAGDGVKVTSDVITAFSQALRVPISEDDNVEKLTINLEGCLQVVLTLVKEVCGMDDEMVLALSEGLCNGTSLGDMRLRLLALVYNSTNEDNTDIRFRMLNDLIRLASNTDNVEKLELVVNNVDHFVESWQLGIDEQRILYQTVAKALQRGDLLERAFDFMLKRLRTYDRERDREQTLQAVSADAAEAVLLSIKLPKMFRYDSLLAADAVTNLKDSEEHGKLYELLQIFVDGRLGTFLEFESRNPEFLRALSLDRDTCETKMRLLTFASLCSEKPLLQYADVAGELHIPEDDVELWVIRSITSGLVEARMNQMTRTVTVTRSTARVFSNEHWTILRENLNRWNDSVRRMLDAVVSARQRVALS